eukprot:9464332-Pyramimonas_sp.AAC.1
MSHPEASRKGGPCASPESSLPLMSLTLKNWQKLHTWRASRFQNVALALAPHLKIASAPRNEGGSFF